MIIKRESQQAEEGLKAVMCFLKIKSLLIIFYMLCNSYYESGLLIAEVRIFVCDEDMPDEFACVEIAQHMPTDGRPG